MKPEHENIKNRLTQLATELMADIKNLEKERDEWKQAYEKAIGDSDSWHWRNQPVTKRISELCEKVTLRDVQIVDLTIERDSYKSMYQSSLDINASLLKEHNELKGTIADLAHHPEPAEHLTDQMYKLISSMNKAGAAAVRPAPGRLEIAAMVLAGMLHDSDTWSWEREEYAKYAVELADTLIATDKEATNE